MGLCILYNGRKQLRVRLPFPLSQTALLHQEPLLTRFQETPFWKKYGFLYDGYDLSRGLWWWEMVILLRKIALVACIVSIKDDFLQVRRAST